MPVAMAIPVSEMDTAHKLSVLKAGIAEGVIPTKDQGFVKSLIQWAETPGKTWSEKQLVWVDKFVVQALAGTPAPPEPTIHAQLGSVQAINDLFDKAGAKLQKPAVMLVCEGAELKLYRKKAKTAVAIIGTTFGSNEWLGQLTMEGHLHLRSDLDPVFQPKLIHLIEQFAAKPAETAAEYGKLTGRCVFCHLPLDDPKSTAVGYGPTCAKNWHLPWGKAK